MKIKLSFKTPDVMMQLERMDLDSETVDIVKKQLSQWIVYNEYICIEFDSETNGLTVLEKGF